MRLKNSIFDIAINILCLIQLVGTIIYLIVVWNSLPEQIPGHFNAAGEVTRYDSRATLLVMPIFAWITFVGIVLVERFPKIWNTGVTITEKNRFRIYRITKSLLGATKLIIVTAFTFIVVIQSLSINLPGWFTPVFLSLLFVSIGVFVIRLIRAR